MPTQPNFGTIAQSTWFRGRVASAPSDPRIPNTQPPLDHNVIPPAHEVPSNLGPTNPPVNTVVLSTCHTKPFGEHLNTLYETPCWQNALDDHLMNVFRESVLSLAEHAIDAVVARTLCIVEPLTRARIWGLALAVCTHWTRLQFHCKNAHACAPGIVALISRMADRIGRLSVQAQRDFLDELNYLCVVKLKLTWRWVRS